MDFARLFVVTGAAALVLACGGCSDLSNREDFQTSLKNKTEPEVLQYAGKPSEVQSADPQHVAWVYKARTFDVPTRKTDAETDVIFTPDSDGKLHVADVVFK